MSLHITYKNSPERETESYPIILVGLKMAEGSGRPTPEVLESLDSFHEDVGWISLSNLTSISKCDVIFEVVDSSNILIGFQEKGAESKLRWLPVTILTTEDYPALPSIIHTVLAPSFAPGLIGVDWEDAKLVLSRGQQGFLTLVSGNFEMSIPSARAIISSHLNLLDQELMISGVLAVMFAHHTQSVITNTYRILNSLESMCPSDQPALVAAPETSGCNSMYALLVITSLPDE